MKKIVCVLLGIVTGVSTFLFCGCSFFDRFSKKEEIVNVSGKVYEFYSLTDYKIVNRLNQETGEVEKEKYYNGTYGVGDKHSSLAGEDKIFQKTELMIYFMENGTVLFNGDDFYLPLLHDQKMTWTQEEETVTVSVGTTYIGYVKEDHILFDYNMGAGGQEIKMVPVTCTEAEKDAFGLYKFQSITVLLNGEIKTIEVGKDDGEGYIYEDKMLYALLLPNGRAYCQSLNFEQLKEKTNCDWTIDGNKIFVTSTEINSFFGIKGGLSFEKKENILEGKWQVTENGQTYDCTLIMTK